MSLNTPTPETQTVILERTFPHPPEKLWRALTQSHLVAQWLLANDFEPTPNRPFQFRADPVPQWDGLIDCKVLTLDPLKSLSYTWTALGVDTVVLFTLTPTDSGTHLRLEHSGFRPDNPAAYKGATYGWQKFLSNLDTVLKETPQ
jgi:uncharacterized protein YndB with AHSA1/START domain